MGTITPVKPISDVIWHSANWTTNLPHNWAGEYTNPNTIGFANHIALYHEIVQWIATNIEDWPRNAMWAKCGDCIYVYVRREQDLVLLNLRWR